MRMLVKHLAGVDFQQGKERTEKSKQKKRPPGETVGVSKKPGRKMGLGAWKWACSTAHRGRSGAGAAE